MIRSKTSILALLSGLAVAAVAIAQPQPPEPPAKTLKGDPDRPLGRGGAGEGGGSSTFSFVQSDGKDTIKVKAVDGEITAEVNGKVIPRDRIRRSEGKIEILDEKGEVQHTVNVQIGGFTEPARVARPKAPREQPGFRVERRGGQPPQVAQPRVQVEAPKVMLGITMSNADATTLDRVGAKSETGVFVDSVIDGLPAGRAGLEVNDLIVGADGKADLTEQGLREILRGKNPGDDVKLRVFRKGETKDLTVKLEAFDAEKLGQARRDVMIEGVPGDWIEAQGHEGPGFVFGGGFDQEKIKSAIQDAIKHLKENSKDWEKVRGEVADHLEEALKEFDAHKLEFNEFVEGFKRNMGNQPRIRLFNNGGLIAPPEAPAPPAEQAQGSGKQLERIADQLDRLNRRLDELEKKLGEKK